MKNVARSIAQRLLTISRKSGEEHNLLLMRFGVERLLYRIGQSEYRNQFILKGATLFLFWQGHAYRTTKDIDFLGIGNPDPEQLCHIFQKICKVDLSMVDGLVFLQESVRVTPIQIGQESNGTRINLRALLERSRIDLQIDIGFGDAVWPQPEIITFPTLLEMPAPVIIAYQKYSALAEKIMAMATLGMQNSRMKDFYDICIMFRTMNFDIEILLESIRATFTARGNALPTEIPAILSNESMVDSDKNIQWTAFTKRSVPAIQIGSWPEVIQEIRRHLETIFFKLGVAGVEVGRRQNNL